MHLLAWILWRIFLWCIWLMLTVKELKLVLNNFIKQQTKKVGISKDLGSMLFLWDYFQNSIFGYSWKTNIQKSRNSVVRQYKAKLFWKKVKEKQCKKHCLGIGKEHRVSNLKLSVSIKEKQGVILCMESHIVRSVSDTDSSIQYGSNKEIQGYKTMEPMLGVWELKVY